MTPWVLLWDHFANFPLRGVSNRNNVQNISVSPPACLQVAFMKLFVAKTCRAIIDDVEKLDAIEDDFMHYQLLLFCNVWELVVISGESVKKKSMTQ
jgi:hypothetical protein